MYGKVNLILGGGGVKGIAYIGAFEALEARGYTIENIVGVSAGAMAGALKAAGYEAQELKDILYNFDLAGIMSDRGRSEMPIVSRYREYFRLYGQYGNYDPRLFFKYLSGGQGSYRGENGGMFDLRGDILNSIMTYGKNGCLCNGDYLEEWVRQSLLKKGVRTFGDLRGGTGSENNPDGYKVLISAVDINRAKLLILPYDIHFYGMDPDSLEVAAAVRMSTSVPFAFKPVELMKKYNAFECTYNIVDGGVFDNFPCWAADSNTAPRTLGFSLGPAERPGVTASHSPLNILKYVLSGVHDLGIPPKVYYDWGNTCTIDTSQVPFLKFDLSNEEKDYLYNAGRNSTLQFLNYWEQKAYGLSVRRTAYLRPAYNRYFY